MSNNKPSGELIRLPIVHVTGDSKKHVMSQWGATQALNGKVNTSQKVNGKPLTTDIVLNSQDIGSPTVAETDTKLNTKLNKTDVLQVLGGSTTQTISQKCASDEIGKMNTNIENYNRVLTQSISTTDARVSSLELNKANKNDVYDKDTTEKTFLKKGSISNALYTGYDQMSYDATKKAFVCKGESLLGRAIWINPKGNTENSVHISLVIPPIPNSLLLGHLQVNDQIILYKAQLDATGVSIKTPSPDDILYISKL